MLKEEQIKALAELDGLYNPYTDYWYGFDWGPLAKYLTSYDAIIPLIQKQPLEIRDRIATKGGPISFMVTPPQLAEKLLRATGKWKE